MKNLLGTLYFEPDRDDNDKPVSRYVGVVVGFVIRRDDGVEVEVRQERANAPAGKRALTYSDMLNLSEGQPVEVISDPGKDYVVHKVFKAYGDVWVKYVETGKMSALKYTDLRRVG